MGEVHELVAAARALQPLVREHAEEAQRLRHVPGEVVRAMAAAGLYRIAAPACFGGAEAHPRPTIEAIE
ncbi:MAG: acyl-CoA dehydrogenase family protein, partial [Acidimicrobiia bacterium]|nr:acyl-CoA dehydrogenase family protein [Acidimicrobiia bacterium]